jgi:hypothetical protein
MNAPLPAPNSTDTVLALKSVTARSSASSSSKSPIAIHAGLAPVGRVVAALKVPVPLPSRTDTLSEAAFATTRSFSPPGWASMTATE